MADERKQNELTKLYELKDIYSNLLEVKKKIHNVKVEDNYERTVTVPDFKVQPPEEVEKPQEQIMTKENFLKLRLHFKGGIILGSIIAGIVFLSFLLSQEIGLFLIFMGIVATVAAINVIKYLRAVSDYGKYKSGSEKMYQIELEKYEKYRRKRHAYNERVKEHEKIVKKHKEEEEKIKDKICEEVEKIQNEIRKKEYDPIWNELCEKSKDVLSEEYFDDIYTIIELMENGRADSIKEAINLFEQIKHREKQLELERERMEKEEADRARAAELAEQQLIEERERQAKLEDMMRSQARAQEEEIKRQRLREEREREQNARDAAYQCRNCLNAFGCRNYGKYVNCPNYRHR